MSFRLGIDVVAVEDVEQTLRAHADHYLDRVYTRREIDDSRALSGEIVAERLAARFAAKEAAIKVLRPTRDVAVPWRAIEVARVAGGWVELRLSGRAEALACDAGLESLTASLTHAGSYAAAVVLAEANLERKQPH